LFYLRFLDKKPIEKESKKELEKKEKKNIFINNTKPEQPEISKIFSVSRKHRLKADYIFLDRAMGPHGPGPLG
jgi:hypothetical protein